MKKPFMLAAALTTAVNIYAQDQPKIKVSGYLETYYGYDFNKPIENSRPGFIYSHNRHNEVNLNLGFIKGAYDDGRVRANLAFMAGTYSNANLSAEPGVLKNVFEANAGVRLSKSNFIWLDAGVFSSHIGFEGAVSKDCWVLTRNISSENTPYYESGVRIAYGTQDGQFSIALLYLNGWQRMVRQIGNQQPAGGMQLTWKPTDKITLNYSNYLGTEGADSVRVKRHYHNLYGIFQFTERFGLTVGMDYGTQQKERGASDVARIVSPVAIAQYKIDSRWSLAGRAEYYKDRDGIFIPSENLKGFSLRGYSLNIDFAPVSNAALRLEGKVYDSDDRYFLRNQNPARSNVALTASVAVWF